MASTVQQRDDLRFTPSARGGDGSGRGDGRANLNARPAAPAAVDSGPPRKVTRDDIIFFTSQLAVMTDTGVPLAEALETIAAPSNHSGLQALVKDLSEQVNAGVTFSAALERHPKLFDRLFVALMKASEASGTMGSMLQRASEYMEQERETRKRVKGAMVYPVCMLSFCVLVVTALLIFVLPRFEKIYAGKGAALPTPTRMLMGMSSCLVTYWYVFLLVIAGGILGAYYYFRTPDGRVLLDKIKIQMPILGPMYRKAFLARSLRTMATMVTTGVSMLDGLCITAEAAGNHFYSEIWKSLSEGVKEGSMLSDQMMNHALIPRTVAQMVAAGERTGKLGMVMNRVAVFCEEDLKVAIKTVTQMIEPLMIIIMGLIVGGIAMALLLPVFTISKVMAQ